MSDNSNLFGMFGDKESTFGSCPPPCPPPCPPIGPGLGAGFGGNNIIIWIIILFFLCRGGFGNSFGNSGCGCGNNSGGCRCGNNCCEPCSFDTGCCTTMIQNPCDFTECCNCCGKRVKKCKKQKSVIVEMCQCGGNTLGSNNNCGCGNSGVGFGCGNGFGFWWIIILIILFCFRSGSGLIGGAPFAPIKPC